MSNFGETVEVAAVAPLLQVDNATVESGTTAKMIETLPNITQNPLAYSMLQAGVVGRTADERYVDAELIRHRRERPAAMVIGGGERRARVHERHPAGWPSGDGRRLQRSVGGAEHRGPGGSEGHLEQLQRRVWPRTGHHLDEHEVGHEQLSRHARLSDAQREPGLEHVLEQRAEDHEAGVPRPRPRRIVRRPDSSQQAVLLRRRTTSSATTTIRWCGRRCRRRWSGSATSARR